MRVGRQALALAAGNLLAEAVEVFLAQAAFHEGTGVHARGGVALEEDLVTARRIILALEEVVQADLVERGRTSVGGDMTADADAWALRAVHHDCCVPTDPAAVALFEFLVAREFWLQIGWNGVDKVGGGQGRQRDAFRGRTLQQAEHQVAGALWIGVIQQAIE